MAVSDRSVTAPARVDRRTKNLLKRVRPGEIAVIETAEKSARSGKAEKVPYE